MAFLNSPAHFGRALNFPNNGFPVWNKSGDTEYEFPNALGLNFLLQAEIDTVADYTGIPLDIVAHVRTGLAMTSHLQTTLTMRSKLLSEIDIESHFPSTRITRNARDA